MSLAVKKIHRSGMPAHEAGDRDESMLLCISLYYSFRLFVGSVCSGKVEPRKEYEACPHPSVHSFWLLEVLELWISLFMDYSLATFLYLSRTPS